MTDPDEVKLLPCGPICDSCGKPISGQPGESYVGSLNGRVWHYGCSPLTRPPVVPDEVVERVIQIVRKHDRDYDRNRMDKLPAQHAAEGLRRKLRAALASMPAVVSGGQT